MAGEAPSSAEAQTSRIHTPERPRERVSRPPPLAVPPPPASGPSSRAAIRGELFGVERLEQFGQILAASHRILPGHRRGSPVLGRLRQNRKSLLEDWRLLADAARDGSPVSPAAEWLLDNFQIVEDQLREIREDLPAGFYRQLPKLADGDFAGYPRVYAIAWAFVEHTDSRFDITWLRRFIASYQRVQPLTIGELWAVAISLRLVLVENLRRLADSVVERRTARHQADQLADELLAAREASDTRRMGRLEALHNIALETPFAVQLIQRLRDCDPTTTPALQWLEDQLARRGTNPEGVIREEHLQQVAEHGSVRNSIMSMRLLSSADWGEFVEGVSLVEAALRDGTGVAELDFATRDAYRHAVEDLARGSGKDELDVAQRANHRAKTGKSDREADPGHWLVASGRPALEDELGYRAPLRQLPERLALASPTVFYVGSVLLVTFAAAVVVLRAAASAGAGLLELVVFAMLATIPATELAVSLVNRFVASWIPPRKLPKLELEQGVPASLRTMVVIPCLLTDEAEVRDLVGRLEVHYLGNDDPDLRFALLSDWMDAETERVAGDEALLAIAREGIAELEERYGPASDGRPRFFVFHRHRRWNEREGRWMGWERKRGKLHELNQLLRGGTDTSFVWTGPSAADTSAIAAMAVRYVVTLDADTRMPRGTVRKLVGAIAHPLNRAVHDPATGRVVEGYGILQPRITPSLPEIGEGTVGQRVFSGPGGIDPYAFAVSDVYQDLFGEGIYTGKGIYDVDAFERAMAGQVPENTLLSHDLLEGLYTRAGLLSDVELFESFPAHYQVVAARSHRWARGDWQLLRWLVGGTNIPPIARWKMLDNLRRTLLAPAALATLVASWFLPSPRFGIWTAFIIAALTIPVLFPVVLELVPQRAGLAARSYIRGKLEDLVLAVVRASLAVVLLVDQAWRMLDAAGRTLYRLLVSRRNLLEWVTAAQLSQGSRMDLGAFYLNMAPAVAIPVLLVPFLGFEAPEAMPLALVFCGVWAASPMIARWISIPPPVVGRALLDERRALLLRHTARRTWLFFETWVTAEDNFLPPDNFQEDPEPVVAHRTSPTNIGLYLLSSVAAHDLGWQGTTRFVERAEATLATLGRMDRHRGHFYNWYDTRSLATLHPRYVSTVDSGNLAGHLLVVHQACIELAARPPSSIPLARSGIADTLAVARETIAATEDDKRGGAVRRRQLEETAEEIDALLAAGPSGEGDAAAGWWSELASRGHVLVDTAEALGQERGDLTYEEVVDWARAVRDVIDTHRADVTTASLAARLLAIADECERLSKDMDWPFLFDREKLLFSIGFNCEDNTLDLSCYDLLASEARLTSFLAIARGQVKGNHWFRLGRRLTAVGNGSALVSWSGSMFEYLMPELVMNVPDGSLIEQTDRLVIARQMRYGRDRDVPWGISEAAYNSRDLHRTYQYSNFGVSGLGLKRGLADDLVIAPYATALAAMVDPVAAADNFVALGRVGAGGRYGFYESVDYTASRLPEGEKYAVVKAFMAHHQGMTIVALCNVLTSFQLRRRFHAIPMVRATELLLHERTPRNVAVARSHTEEESMHLHVREVVPPVLRTFQSPHDALPPIHRLSNGRYSVAFTAAGGGMSQWNQLSVTRWRPDEALDSYGSFIYVRDCTSGKVWSAGHQPAGVEADEYHASFFEHRLEVRRRDGAISTQLDVVVCPQNDGELRQVTIVNNGNRSRTLELTSYAEIALAPQGADVSHPAFSNLFVQTSFESGMDVLLATRRPRSAKDERVWAAHLAVVHGVRTEGVQFETDRARFLGRGRTVRTASAVFDGRPLSNTVGAVLDPIFSLRRRITVDAGQTARVVFTTLIGNDREQLLGACDTFRDAGIVERTLGEAWTHAQIQLRHLGIDAEEAHLYQRLGTRLVYADPALRASREVIQRNRLGQTSLWGFGISGDRPILMGRIEDVEDRDLVRQLVHAQCSLQLKGFVIDLVLLNERAHTYGHDPQAIIESLVRTSQFPGVHVIGGVHVVRGDKLSQEQRDLLFSVARVVVQSRDGSLAEQMMRVLRQEPGRPPVRPVAPIQPRREVPPPRLDLEFFNGVGGFGDEGRTYVTVLGARQWSPLPWSNVVANADFGFLITESGGGFTWSENSREHQLTPWSNDPVSDPPGEVIYLRDEDTGEVWTPTPLPIREETPYVVRHGQGYTRFEHESHGIGLELTVLVAPDDPVKISPARIHNSSGRTRQIRVTAYVEWVLGFSRATSSQYVVTSIDKETGALFAHNPWRPEFADRTAFLDLGGLQTTWSGDRVEFLGRNGSHSSPAGLARTAPSGVRRTGAGLDPCGMLATTIRLEPGETHTVVVVLGDARGEAEARQLVTRYRQTSPETVLEDTKGRWDQVLGTVQVHTPDRAMDLLMNRWLLYQTLSCRLWARAAFYQAGGAYGFRDQLQDVMALLLTRPDLARDQIVRAAARQFVEGDVQHWWHPPLGKGVRTQFADDRVWLPYVLSEYLRVTGDQAILEEQQPFLVGPLLGPDQEDLYLEPEVTSDRHSLYEHAARALDVSLKVGVHGLPLIGGGDWNDGMNRVGQHGKGESVWMAWFLLSTLNDWIPVATERGDSARAARWTQHVRALHEAVEAEGWDGDWYRRAFMDDGTPLGSAANVECRIDSLAQSWAVLSGAGRVDRAIRGMAAVDEHLVRRSDGILLLLTPPFDRTPLDPGYIKGYLPGIRENGGQYTHAALWTVMAFAELGEGNKAGDLFAMLNPVNHAANRAGLLRYKVEPYVVAADVYGNDAHVGRGGWTWYTGSASWMYRAGLESILGIRVRGEELCLAPCIPAAWPSYRVELRHGTARYDIRVSNPNSVQHGIVELRLDGELLDAESARVPLVKDGRAHRIDVTMGRSELRTDPDTFGDVPVAKLR